MILTPFYCYYMAVKQHQEKPFPSATITSTACHYSQDIVCRFFMVIGSSILCLIYYLVFKWIENAQKKAGFPKKISSTLYWTAQFSILLYAITLGTIDDNWTSPQPLRGHFLSHPHRCNRINNLISNRATSLRHKSYWPQ
jgi:hypothetical protein